MNKTYPMKKIIILYFAVFDEIVARTKNQNQRNLYIRKRYVHVNILFHEKPFNNRKKKLR